MNLLSLNKLNMAQNIMRVNSINDRYVTEAMIGLNLNLNEEIDFDFFDDIQTPSEEILSKERAFNCNTESMLCSPVNIKESCEEIRSKEEPLVTNMKSRPCSPVSEEDDDDVQVSPQIVHQNLIETKTKLHQGTGSTRIEDSVSSDSVGDPSSTNTESEENLVNSPNVYLYLENSDDTDNSGSIQVLHKDPETQTSPSLASEIREAVSSHKAHKTIPDGVTKNFDEVEGFMEGPTKLPNTMESYANCNMAGSVPLNTWQKPVNLRETFIDPKTAEDQDSKTDLLQPDHFASSKSYVETDSLPLEEDALSCKANKSHESGASGSHSDSDEGCPFEGSDSEELLLAVHTLTVIPRSRHEMPSTHLKNVSELFDDTQKTDVHSALSCEKANVTARSSSGYSSASYKTQKKASNSKAHVRQPSPVKISTPDMDEFIRSFRSLQPDSPVVSFSSYHQLSSQNPSRKKSRKNMSFTNEELKRIERENAILLNKIVLQQRARPPVVHNYERRVCSNAINRARQLKRIECDNEILLRKIQDVKRRSSSTSSSRCTSQASSSQL